MTAITRLLLVDPSGIIADGISCLLERFHDFEVVAKAADGREALRLAHELKPDVVLMELSVPELNGIDATRKILAEVPGARVIAFSGRTDGASVSEMLAAGATGYLVKDVHADELARAIRTVAGGKVYLHPDVAQTMVKRRNGDAPEADPVFENLTAREREVLQLVSEGRSSKEIAARLKITVSTVDSHRHHVMKKLGVTSVAELVKIAIRAGLTTLET
jgi:DNA-binding NarL/FixJ family response regulator